ncbi:XRE family transcriptional regulator [Pantoea sp. C2G6]|uniref:XRE family transcriptional regulator n=1 Tax=Pantoea sp. C2G6 TaxID=3243084 RepID=UPI003EDA042D
MNLYDIDSLLENLPESEKKKVIAKWALENQSSDAAMTEKSQVMTPEVFALLPQRLVSELKRQNITYEEMAIQIGVSLSTFKRMIAKPSSAKAVNLHALLRELGIKVWIEK